jgi:hypothetical protein
VTDILTYEELAKVLTPRLAKSIPQSAIANINAMLADSDMAEAYKENLISYQSVLSEGKFKITSYIDAVKYVSHKLRGLTNKDAYFATFPNKQLDWDNRGVSDKDQSSYISIYHNSKLVSKILEQSIVPSWVLNQDLFQRALKKQVDLMDTAKSEMVKHLAAKTILDTLKRPEATELKIDIGTKETSIMKGIKDSVEELVAMQRQKIIDGTITAEDAAEQMIAIDGEYTDVS